MTYEDDDLDDTVDELRWEVSLDSAHNELPCLRSYRTFTHVVEVRRTKIRRHNNNRVPEVNDTALTVIEDLQEQLYELAGCFLDFDDEDNAVMACGGCIQCVALRCRGRRSPEEHR